MAVVVVILKCVYWFFFRWPHFVLSSGFISLWLYKCIERSSLKSWSRSNTQTLFYCLLIGSLTLQLTAKIEIFCTHQKSVKVGRGLVCWTKIVMLGSWSWSMVLVKFKIHGQKRTRADAIILNHSTPLKSPKFELDSEAAVTRHYI